jgi:DNA-binding transcriptional LysR family regulator
MNTSHLNYFITISETGSLTRAAEKLHVSQPVLSRYIKALEQEQGLAMFQRDRGAYRLTEAGRIYLNGVIRIQELRTQMLRQLMALSGHAIQRLDIGMSPYQGGREIASFYPPLLNRFPMIELNIMENNSAALYKALKERNVTCLLTLYDKELMPETRIASLQTFELLLVLPEYHPLCAPYRGKTDLGTFDCPASTTLEQFLSLTDVPFILLDEHTSVAGVKIHRFLTQAGLKPQIFLKTSNSIALSLLLSSGSYASIIIATPSRKVENLCYFHLPTRSFCTSGMIFRQDYEPSTIECFLYKFEVEHAAEQGRKFLDINTLGENLLIKAQKENSNDN